MEKKLELSLLLEFYGKILSERQRELIEYYCNDDLSLAEISELTGITRQGARDGIKKAELILEDCEVKLGMYKAYSDREKALEKLLSLAERLAGKYSFGSDPGYTELVNTARALAGQDEDI